MHICIYIYIYIYIELENTNNCAVLSIDLKKGL